MRSYTEHELRRVEAILPRLKHSVQSSKILRWLQNFDEQEVDLALDILRVYEYITFEELMYRLDDELKNILLQIPSGNNILIFPYGKMGKSGTLVSYPLKNTLSFQKREKEIVISQDTNEIVSGKYKYIIFIDDFVGSGHTFKKEFKTLQSLLTINSIKEIYLLCAVIMHDGKQYISQHCPNVKIFAEERRKIFDANYSPFSAFKNLPDIQKLAEKYGNQLNVFSFYPFSNYQGYDNSQALLSFSHGTPNNTLPIIWGRNKNWFPIFPRESKVRMSDARKFKKEIAYLIGVCNRIGIDLYDFDKTIVVRDNGRRKRKIKYNSKLHLSVIAVLRLKQELFDDIIICHILGLTINELMDVYKEALNLRLIDESNNLRIGADVFLEKMKNLRRLETFKKETKDNLNIKNILYLPDSFNGKT